MDAQAIDTSSYSGDTSTDKELTVTPESTPTKSPAAKAPVAKKAAPRKASAKTTVAKAAAPKATNGTGTSASQAPASPAPKKARRTMSDDHKNALAQGRNEGRAVKSYLNALESNRPKRGRKRTAESISKRLDAIETRLFDADPITRLQLIQERLDLQSEAARLQETNDLTELEAEFIKVAKSYGDRKGITSAAWRSLSVPKDVLRKAGV